MLDQLRKGGVQVQVYHPFDNLASLDISRDHRKSIVVDGQTAFVGGMNTGDKYLGGPHVPGRLHDVFTRIQGPAVPNVLGDFLSSWKAAGGDSPSPASLTAPLAAGQSATPGNVPVRIIEHTPGQDANIRTAYLAMINHATKSIYVENSYPMSSDLVQALVAAQKRGVDVKYIVGTHQGLIGEAARENFKQLVDAGVHVYLYPTPIHTKSLSVDGQICSVGSSNVDDVALTRNREIVSVISDPGYTQSYDQAVFQKDLVGNSLGQKTIELKEPFSEPLWRSVADSVLSGVWPDSLQ
jgi:cardiolipin synthase